MKNRLLILCTTDSMIYNFLIPHVKDLENLGYEVFCACSRTGDFFDVLKNQCGFKMYQIDFERSPYNPRNLKAYKQLTNLVKEKKIGLIFCHEPVGGAMGRIVGHAHKCKVIYMAHGFHFYKGAPRSAVIYYVVERFLSRYTDVLITINQEDYEVAKKFHAKSVYKTNGIGIDTEKFICAPNPSYIRNELRLAEKDIVLLSVGELIPRKNHIVIIKALNKIANPRIHYVIAGEGDYRKVIEQVITDCDLKQNVHLLGYRRDINQLCNSSDIFVLPSLQEGLSVALMEAMACGKSTIVSSIRGNVDLIDENKGGLYSNPEDVNGFAKAITRLAYNENERIQFGQYNQRKVFKYSIDRVRNQINTIFENLSKKEHH